MNTATMVEETLRGLPDKITVYMPWDYNLDEPGLWQDCSENQFPCVYLTYEQCVKAIAEFAIDTFQAVARGELLLPTTVDEARRLVMCRDGRFSGENITMFDLVKERGDIDGRFCETTFNREFAHYYAGLVAQQRNKH